MRILLFITDINNTFDIVNKEDYINLINILNKLKNIGNYDMCYISFCDYTENKDILMKHIRYISNNIDNKQIYFGKQFLGDVYYNDIKSGAILYKKKLLNKTKEILNYVKEFIINGDELEVIIVDNNINILEIAKELNFYGISPFSLISKPESIEKLNIYLENLYNLKKKELKF